MERVMIQAEPEFLDRVRRAAQDHHVSFPEYVRQALEHEMLTRGPRPPLPQSGGVINTGGAANRGEYEPDPWR